MERSPGAITRPRPWDVLWQHKGEEAQPLPSGTKLIDLFHQDAGDALLILGEPGSGKTTMLLELARDLLDQAEQDETLRIPIVFNLSSWVLKRPPLTEWLAAELNSIYQIPPKVVEAWVKKDEILPLLDGLDEVAQAQRVACIEAINTYRAEHGLTPMVVCSRIANYEAVRTKLTLSDALILRPLTKVQVDEYLAAAGPAFNSVRQALAQDMVLQEMTQTPLLLSIMALTFGNEAPEKLFTGSLVERRNQLFAAYTEKMLCWRRTEKENVNVARRQLVYLANQMIERRQSIFFVGRLQSDWLRIPNEQHVYQWTTRLVKMPIGVLFFGLVYFLYVGLITVLVRSVGELVGAVVFAGIVAGSFAGLIYGYRLVLSFGLPLGARFGGAINSTIIEGLTLKLVRSIAPSNNKIRHLVTKIVRVALMIGLGLWLSMGLFFGACVGAGALIIQHYTLRFWLHYYGYLPIKLVSFLDHAADRLILQKVGGGYRFVHRLLQEYLASLYTEEGGGH